MDNETAKLQWAKMFMDYLSNGVDPVTNMDADGNTLQNQEVQACFRYIAEVLGRSIDDTGAGTRAGNKFFITDEQISQLKIFPDARKVSEIANEINRAAAENGTRKLSATKINDWLEAEGYLYKNETFNRVATEKGKLIGITSQIRRKENGDEYYINLFSENAQSFVFRHLSEITSHRSKRKAEDDILVNIIDYPDDVPVDDFVQQRGKCFIMAVGNCGDYTNSGSYIAVMLYGGRSKVLKKYDIPEDSARKCMLRGILDAAASIKSPVDVVILTHEPLGFNISGGRNRKFCRQLCRSLAVKKCSISEAVCYSRNYELDRFIRSFA